MTTIDPDLELEQLQAELLAKSDEKAPKRIYLQRYYDDLEEPQPGLLPWPRETTWCEDDVGDHDVEYVRADVVATLRQALAAADKILTGPLQGYSSIDMAVYKRAKALAEGGG